MSEKYLAANTMKALRIHGVQDIHLDHVVKPEPGPRDILISITFCGICGSDLAYYRQGGLIGLTEQPLAIGHELSGVVVSIGSEVEGIAVGQRVTVEPLYAGNHIGAGGSVGGFAEYLLVANASLGENVFILPDTINDKQGALIEPLGIAMHAINQTELKCDDKIVICGAGTIGLGILAILNHQGYDNIIVTDRSPARLQRARNLGAKATVNVAEESLFDGVAANHGTCQSTFWKGLNTDVYFEATGASSVVQEILNLAKGRAQITYVATYKEDMPINFTNLMLRELVLRGSFASGSREFQQVIDMLHTSDTNIEDDISSHTYGMEDYRQAFETALNPEDSAKVFLAFGSEHQR